MGKEGIVTDKKRTKYMELIAETIESAVGNNCVIIFFGSILTDKFNRTSDIDVAVFGKDGLSDRKYLEILDRIDKLPILREVDLINLNTTKNAELMEEIISKGQVWKSSEEAWRDLENLLKSLKR